LDLAGGGPSPGRRGDGGGGRSALRSPLVVRERAAPGATIRPGGNPRARASGRRARPGLRVTGRRPAREFADHRVTAVREDAFDVAPDPSTAQPGGPRQVLDVIENPGTTVDRLEAVLVTPPAVGPEDLAIDETDAGLPHIDPRAPRDRHAVQPDAVVDQRALAQLAGTARPNPE